MLKRNFVLFILLLLMSAVYVNYKPENIVENVSININNGINLSIINERTGFPITSINAFPGKREEPCRAIIIAVTSFIYLNQFLF